ncbi:PREDICTED: uncharacterized protein LOC106338468 [Brassica oleracea var. oleracea]|uniref:uncharacterized protein LOC106338468 n=1 Tax=Brassica oleracea var. oleracea TaxID=109376 RepID=UPI0006A73B18|nr:PREDICTED: uncharacterized protein LOC106338468 [Brassica oleracea var. oleracea]
MVSELLAIYGATLNKVEAVGQEGAAGRNHMTPNEKIFVRLNTNINVPIRVGNGAVMISKGKGDIKVMTKKGKRIIRDVLLVPNLGKSLLSIPQIITNGYQVTFKRSKCIIHDQAGRKIGEIPMVNKSFHIKWSTEEETAMVANEDIAELWHNRLGHTCFTNKRDVERLTKVQH